MDYQTAISAACRTLTARGSLTLTTGYTYALSADDILSFRFEEGVQGGDMLLGGALAEAQQAMAAALQSAVNKLSASLNVTVPVYIDSTRVANAVVNQVRRRLVSGGRSLA